MIGGVERQPGNAASEDTLAKAADWAVFQAFPGALARAFDDLIASLPPAWCNGSGVPIPDRWRDSLADRGSPLEVSPPGHERASSCLSLWRASGIAPAKP